MGKIQTFVCFIRNYVHLPTLQERSLLKILLPKAGEAIHAKIERLEQNINHNFAELRSSLNHIIDHLTKISDLPEE